MQESRLPWWSSYLSILAQTQLEPFLCLPAAVVLLWCLPIASVQQLGQDYKIWASIFQDSKILQISLKFADLSYGPICIVRPVLWSTTATIGPFCVVYFLFELIHQCACFVAK